ncbi:UNVERIFIED_ORG: hypothetical protein FHR35_007224 [Microbispora rosea subsp. rosea]
MRFVPRLGAARSRLRRGVVAVTAFAALACGAVVAAAPQASAAAGCQVTYTVTSQWSGGFGANIDVKNLGDPISNWTLKFSFAAGQTISQLWNGAVSQSGADVTVTNASFNGGLGTGATAQVGFNGTWNNTTNPAPAAFTLNGVTCTGSVTTSPTPSPTASPTPSPTRSPSPSPSPSPSGSPAARDGWSTIQAESYDSSGGSLQVCSGVLCYVAAGAWTQYNNVDLHSGTTTVQMSVANGGGNTAIQVWVGGVNTATLTVGGTGGWDTYQTKSLTLPAQNGVKDVKLVFVNGNVNLDWLKFSATTTTPSPSLSASPSPTPTIPPPGGDLKPRVIVMTDITSANWEPDDMESFIHLLSSADMFEIEGLISTTGWSLDGSSPLQTYHLNDVIDAYERDLPKLMKRSGQTGFMADESRQPIGYWPSPAYLRSLVKEGQPDRGMDAVGDGKSSPGSQQVIKVVDDSDPRPVWVTFWGGGNTLAQAIWDVRKTRSADQLNTFMSKVRVHAITDQDRGYDGEGYANSAQFWMRKNFKNLFYIWSESAWGEYGSKIKSTYWSQYTSKIQGHGALGGMYPTWKYIVEGDTPSWLYLWPGLNDPQDPSQASFGGRFVYGTGPDGQTQAYLDNSGDAANKSRAAVDSHLQDTVNDFISRIGWATNGTGNRNPRLVVTGNSGYAPVVVNVSAGATVSVSAAGSGDPDGNSISYGWSQDTGAGYAGAVSITGATSQTATVQVPSAAAGKDIHIVLRAADNGSPSLASYRRVVLHVN